jgi:hypothetical protein
MIEDENIFKDWSTKDMREQLIKLIRKKYKMKVLKGVKILIEDLI